MMGRVRTRSSSRNNRGRSTIFGNLGGVSLLGSGRFLPGVGGSILFDMVSFPMNSVADRATARRAIASMNKLREQSADGVLNIREAYLAKRRSFWTRTFHASRFTNDEDGLFEHPAFSSSVVLDVQANELHRATIVSHSLLESFARDRQNTAHLHRTHRHR